MSRIYKKVRTNGDFDLYYNILKHSWIEMDYTLECLIGDVSRYIILNDLNNPVGTLEIIPYKTPFSNYLNSYFPFNEDVDVLNNIERIVEVDCVSIHPEYRKQGNLDKIGYIITEHSRKNNIKYCLALMNPMLYRALKNTYHIPVKKIGTGITNNNNNTTVYPVIIDAEYVYTNIDKYPWLRKLYELDKEPVESIHLVKS